MGRGLTYALSQRVVEMNVEMAYGHLPSSPTKLLLPGRLPYFPFASGLPPLYFSLYAFSTVLLPHFLALVFNFSDSSVRHPPRFFVPCLSHILLLGKLHCNSCQRLTVRRPSPTFISAVSFPCELDLLVLVFLTFAMAILFP